MSFKKLYYFFIWLFALTMLVTGCRYIIPASNFNPPPIGEHWMKKVDTFMIIFDSSISMSDQFHGTPKFDRAITLIKNFNQTIPDIKLSTAIRTFGNAKCPTCMSTDLIYGFTSYSKSDFEKALKKLKEPYSESPLHMALTKASSDLQSIKGNIALIIVSDWNDLDKNAIRSVNNLRDIFGDRLSIYNVMVGNDYNGKQLMNQLKTASVNGQCVNEEDLASLEGMQMFIRNVFLVKGKDSDNDGVSDDSDQCPDTPIDIEVDKNGCPPDSDNDGVHDLSDQCPNTPNEIMVDLNGCPIDSDADTVPDSIDLCHGTPLGIKVDEKGCPWDSDADGISDERDQCPNTPRDIKANAVGCWVIEGLYFDSGKYDIEPKSYPYLNKLVQIIKQSSSLCFEIQGHTDNVGSDNFNMKLSAKRADSVVSYLIRKGVSGKRLFSRGFGPYKPIASNSTKAGQNMNRRIEIQNSECDADTDKDGVPDFKDICPSTPSDSKVNESGCLVQ